MIENPTLCFTGHRYYNATPDREAQLLDALRAAWADGYRTFISGMAPGFDLAAAEAVVRLREAVRTGEIFITAKELNPKEGMTYRPPDVRLVAAIPFAGQASGYSAADRARYDALWAAADEVRVLSERYSYGSYYRRDDWMVERSGRIICWYDGGNGHGGLNRASRTGSGTRYTVRRALAAGLEIVNLFCADGTLF